MFSVTIFRPLTFARNYATIADRKSKFGRSSLQAYSEIIVREKAYEPRCFIGVRMLIVWRRRRDYLRAVPLMASSAGKVSVPFLLRTSPPSRANSCLIHDFERLVFSAGAKKGSTKVLPCAGAEDEIRTRATGKGTTPLAGEPLEPLGYFCISCCAAARSRAHTLYHKRGELSKYIFPNFQKKSKKSCACLAGAAKVC